MLAIVALASGCTETPANPSNGAPYSQTDVRVGTGAEAGTTGQVTVNYTGWLYDPAKTDSQLAIVAFAYNSNTKGNAATEIVKYFLQEHYNLGVDLTRPDLLQQDNFYSN